MCLLRPEGPTCACFDAPFAKCNMCQSISRDILGQRTDEETEGATARLGERQLAKQLRLFFSLAELAILRRLCHGAWTERIGVMKEKKKLISLDRKAASRAMDGGEDNSSALSELCRLVLIVTFLLSFPAPRHCGLSTVCFSAQLAALGRSGFFLSFTTWPPTKYEHMGKGPWTVLEFATK